MRLDQLADLAYEPANQSGEWDVLLNALRRHFSATAACLIEHDYAEGKGTRRSWVGLDPGFDLPYERYYAQRNPWLLSEREYRYGQVHFGEELLANHELVKTEFYHDYLKPQDCFHRLCGIVERDGSCLTCLIVHRPRRRSPFTPEDRDAVAQLVPHVGRGLKLQRRLLRYRAENESFLDLLHRLSVATFVVDRHGRLIECNRAGEDLVKQGDGLMLRQGRLAAASRNEDRQLKRTIGDTVGMALTPARRGGGHVAVSRPSSGGRIVLLVCPIRPGMTPVTGWDEPAAIIVTKDPDSKAEAGCCTFTSLYGLTPAEARLATHIIGGSGVVEAARRIGISQNTARTHMKRIYAKTGALNQAGLVRLHDKACANSH